jgi:hypothetical protein
MRSLVLKGRRLEPGSGLLGLGGGREAVGREASVVLATPRGWERREPMVLIRVGDVFRL